jgi:hypothetical protein
MGGAPSIPNKPGITYQILLVRDKAMGKGFLGYFFLKRSTSPVKAKS